MNLIERAHRALAGVTLNEGTDDWCKLSIRNEDEVLTPLIKAGVLGPSEAEQAVIEAADNFILATEVGIGEQGRYDALRHALTTLSHSVADPASAPDEADANVPRLTERGTSGHRDESRAVEDHQSATASAPDEVNETENK